MKWVLIIIYVGGFGTPVHKTMESFSYEKDCRSAASDFMKKHDTVTAVCDYRKPPQSEDDHD